VLTSLLDNIMTYNISLTYSMTMEFMSDYFLVKMAAETDKISSEQYNVFSSAHIMHDFGGDRTGKNVGFVSLRNTSKMVDLAPEAQKDTYRAFALFIKAYQLYYVTSFYGDIPYREAAQGETLTLTPKYDTQKEVFAQILDDLDYAYALFSASSITMSGDYVFNGDPKKWAKTVASFELNVLLALSKKADANPDLQVKERFARIVAERTLFESNDDNMTLTFSSSNSSSYYALNEQRGKLFPYFWVSSYIVDMIKRYDDCRLFAFAEPADSLIEAGIPRDSYDAYIGIDQSLPFATTQSLGSRGKGCHLNKRYTDLDNKVGEPLAKLGYAQLNFTLAEGALRGWLQGGTQKASEYMKKGVEAGMKFTAANTPEKYNNGRPLTDALIAEHLNHPSLQLTGAFEADLEKVLEQKYLASFIQYQRDVYLDYRRTGYPKLPINPETTMNHGEDKTKMQLRYKYPASELSYNQDNLQEAVNRQFNGFDDENQAMWLIQ
jgi:hypothetical protein